MVPLPALILLRFASEVLSILPSQSHFCKKRNITSFVGTWPTQLHRVPHSQGPYSQSWNLWRFYLSSVLWVKSDGKMEHRFWWLGAPAHAVPHPLPPACLPWQYSQHPFPWSLSPWAPPAPLPLPHPRTAAAVQSQWGPLQVQRGFELDMDALQHLRWGMGAAVPALGQHGGTSVDRAHSCPPQPRYLVHPCAEVVACFLGLGALAPWQRETFYFPRACPGLGHETQFGSWQVGALQQLVSCACALSQRLQGLWGPPRVCTLLLIFPLPEVTWS